MLKNDRPFLTELRSIYNGALAAHINKIKSLMKEAAAEGANYIVYKMPLGPMSSKIQVLFQAEEGIRVSGTDEGLYITWTWED